jgi:ribose 5-phosphate isomerase B
MNIYISSDHAGLDLKTSIIGFLSAANFNIEDYGPHSYDPEDDYPLYIDEVAKKVAEDPENNRGIIIGGSGQGEAISANRFKGVRAALYYGGGKEIIKLSREHNNSNVLSLGARFLSEEEAKQAVSLWLNTKFSGDERHVRRIREIDELSKLNFDN